MLIRIHGDRLPGLSCGEHQNVYAGLQRKKEPEQLVAGDAVEAVFLAEVEVSGGERGYEFRGPHVQGTAGSRFIYLTWGEHPDASTFTMFGRAKLQLDAIPGETLAAAVATGCLEGRLSLSDAHGRPVCAAVRPPLITWTAARL